MLLLAWVAAFWYVHFVEFKHSLECELYIYIGNSREHKGRAKIIICNTQSESYVATPLLFLPCCFAAGCCNPISPFNGSVSGFTSARAGANITYLCGDTLELDGESIATCSSTSLLWEPSATVVRCIQPYSGIYDKF